MAEARDAGHFAGSFHTTFGRYLLELSNPEGYILCKELIAFPAMRVGAILALENLTAVGEVWPLRGARGYV